MVDKANKKELLYKVYHPDAAEPSKWFETWKEALTMQVLWNKTVPGHRARKEVKIC